MPDQSPKDFRRKDIRLPDQAYRTDIPISVTICTEDKQPHLESKWVRRSVLGAIFETARKCEFRILAYVFMADHVHLIVKRLGDMQLSAFIGKFKQETGYGFRQNEDKQLWQKSFYDHIIRGDEDLNQAVYYILNNPVRKGIVEDWKDYAYCGGELVDKLRYE